MAGLSSAAAGPPAASASAPFTSSTLRSFATTSHQGESGFRWREERPAPSATPTGAGGAGAAGGEKLTMTKPSLDVPSLASLPGEGAASAAQPVPAAAGGGGAAVRAAGAGGGGVGVAASPKEVAAAVEERVKDLVDEVKDELSRGLKGLHLELLRGQEGMRETVAGLAAAVAALTEENRQLRGELAEMRTLGY